MTPGSKPLGAVLSRYDRLGDLVLSLPSLGLLRQAGVSPLHLHVSPYARDVGEWARFNGLCDSVLSESNALPARISDCAGLALFHCADSVKFFHKAGIEKTMGPRSKVSALWSYTKSLSQHRSEVRVSEMQYNVELSEEFLKWQGITPPDFVGLPALRVPAEWEPSITTPDKVLILHNLGSAANWPLEKYISKAREFLDAGHRVDLLCSGTALSEDSQRLKSEFSSYDSSRVRILKPFESVSKLIGFLAKASEVVSSSTGPLHLAHAAGVPVLGLFPTLRVQSFKRWRPHGFWHSAPVRYLEIPITR